jgi:exopolysaccharide biosynthesis WecB/TagA/CpsF family protein
MSDATAVLARRLADDWFAGRGACVTWLNHHSALKLLPAGLSSIAPIDYVGIDGLFLHTLLGRRGEGRTSADLVVPQLLPLLRGARIALVGTRRPSLDQAAQVITEDLIADAGSAVVDTRDGYGELPTVGDIAPWLTSCRPDVVIVGLGAVLQEEWAMEVRARLPAGLVITCGGFLDQVHRQNYYPGWAYPLRLNWAVRVAREPRRLWRRYSVEALTALGQRRALRAEIGGLSGFLAYQAVVAERGSERGDRNDTEPPPPGQRRAQRGVRAGAMPRGTVRGRGAAPWASSGGPVTRSEKAMTSSARNVSRWRRSSARS